ncbi:hypothetical protein LCGC14_2829490, partial [marine sediment metagenome]
WYLYDDQGIGNINQVNIKKGRHKNFIEKNGYFFFLSKINE